jgi:peptidoglycan-N-acetylglucosamine deacetylase
VRRFVLAGLLMLVGFGFAQRAALPLVQSPKGVPGALQPLAPGQRPAKPLPELVVTPLAPEISKVEYASNGFIEVAHALVLVPNSQGGIVPELNLAQAAVQRTFEARASLDEVDVSVYRAGTYDGFGGPLPRLTASVPRARLNAFLALQPGTIQTFDRVWVNSASVPPKPSRTPSDVLEQTPVYDGDDTAVRAQQVKQLASQVTGSVRGGLFFHGSSLEPVAALSFDDAPHPLYEPLLLDTLRRAGIKATFFCIGRNAKAYPYFVRDMVKQGHEVGNHTFHHVRLLGLSESAVRDELESANTVLTSITGQPVRYFRPPGGEYSPLTLRIASSLGLTTAFWTDDPGDFDNIGEVKLRSKLTSRLRYGGIVLLHDNVLQTIDVLRPFLQTARTRGIKLVTVGELDTRN